jgi:putative redox protein
MNTKTTLDWIGGIAFEVEVDGHKLNLDLAAEKGGKNLGPRPKPLLLAALSGCSAMDAVSILDKMKIRGYKLKIEMEAEPTTEHPVIYKTIWMNFRFSGDNLPSSKIIQAIEMSITKYCGVYAMLSKASEIKAKIFINQLEVWSG